MAEHSCSWHADRLDMLMLDLPDDYDAPKRIMDVEVQALDFLRQSNAIEKAVLQSQIHQMRLERHAGSSDG